MPAKRKAAISKDSTATPSKATFGFFDRNRVTEKGRRLAGVLDGVSGAKVARSMSRRAEPANQYSYLQVVADGPAVGGITCLLFLKLTLPSFRSTGLGQAGPEMPGLGLDHS
ncbi:MAG: hypothetical protein RLZ97_729 [Verrucomicrobiota bacterium]|jgi:hypothetical protein